MEESEAERMLTAMAGGRDWSFKKGEEDHGEELKSDSSFRWVTIQRPGTADTRSGRLGWHACKARMLVRLDGFWPDAKPLIWGNPGSSTVAQTTQAALPLAVAGKTSWNLIHSSKGLSLYQSRCPPPTSRA